MLCQSLFSGWLICLLTRAPFSLQKLCDFLMDRCDETLKPQISEIAAYYVSPARACVWHAITQFISAFSRWLAFLTSAPLSQEHRMQIGSKAVFHIEAFLARFMHLYKKFFIENYIM